VTDFVFVYGSLLELAHAGQCVLRDHRRGWDVAMDNRVTIPGYKFYVDPETGERPPVYVAYLAIAPERGSTVAGAAYAADAAALAALDRRERNYRRREVTGLVGVNLGGRVWAYVGSAAGRARCARGRAEGTAVVAAEYLALVPSAEPPDLPVRSLLRRDIGA